VNLTDIGVIKSIQSEFGFRFSKGLGQNFLVNPSVCPRIAEMGCEPGSGVIEIGAGFGVLTKELCERAGKVVCVEFDKSLLPVLEKTVPYKNLTVINEDILKCDLKTLIETEFAGFEKVFVCANLPYYITSPVIMKLLEERLDVAAITVMVQKEAAARLCVQCGTRESGAVTYAVRYFSEPEILFNVSRGSFYPPPNVDSAVIKLSPRKISPLQLSKTQVSTQESSQMSTQESTQVSEMQVSTQVPTDSSDNNSDLKTFEDGLFKLIKAAFSKRRKTFANAVSSGTGIPKAEIFAVLEELGLNADIRPERLTLDDFCNITRALNNDG
jgi:16S rRNA (adenine1518-N6/adenine1519-N6)-dimethyltransferase